MPGWSSAHPGALTAQFLKEAWLDKEIPVVLLDVRPARVAAKGSIHGAVAAPAGAGKAAIARLALPPAEKKPPIVVYDEGKGEAAAALARRLVGAGYNNVRVLEGGFAAWQQAQYAAAQGPLATTVKWAPKPKQGEIGWDEFLAIAKTIPEDTVVLDVRNEDEVKQWMIPGAKNVPAEEVEKHLAEIPQDKRIVTHCSTGVRAEMTYHVLKDKGYARVAFVNANVEVGKDGAVKLSR
jgi:rhodanese-related sulfurtransferase